MAFLGACNWGASPRGCRPSQVNGAQVLLMDGQDERQIDERPPTELDWAPLGSTGRPK